MNQFPEIYSGDVGITSMQYCSGTADITAGGGNFSTVELYNPAGSQVIITLTGFNIFVAVASNLKILKAASATDVSTAADVPPFFMDFRPIVASIGTLAKGSPASVLGSELWRIPILAATGTLYLSTNFDLPPGSGVNFACDVAATRMVVCPIWIERVQTS